MIGNYYEEKVDKIRSSVLRHILFTLPHIIPTIILCFIYPQYSIPIIILGILLPDYAIFEYHILNAFGKRENITTEMKRKKISHILTLILSLALLIPGFWQVSLSGFLHLILDFFGF